MVYAIYIYPGGYPRKKNPLLTLHYLRPPHSHYTTRQQTPTRTVIINYYLWCGYTANYSTPYRPNFLSYQVLESRGEHGQDQDWISCGILAVFSDQDWIWILIFEKNWIRTGSGYWFDFKEISLRVVQNVINDGVMVVFPLLLFLYLQKNKTILSVSTALITINDNSCYVTVYFFLRSGSRKLLL